ncbi:hypothetical protein JCM8097_000432 [Rhodosporidiobolus ruineniae]
MSDSAQQTHSVHVSGLASTTTKETLEHFFSFCGKIVSIAHEGDSAKIEFAKASAAKTALFLTGGHLDGAEIKVTSDDVEAPKLAGVTPSQSTAQTPAEKHGEEIEQEDKPHSAKLAEYLAHGYTIGDQAIAKAIEADKSYGISQRFLSFFNPLKEKAQTVAQPHVERAANKLHEVDESKGLSLKAKAGLIIGSKYYTAALNSPAGAKVQQFYTSTAKTIQDLHEEALRIKEAKSHEAAPSSTASTSGSGPVNPAAGATATQLPHDAPLPSTGTVSATDTSAAATEKPLETTAAPLRG